MRRATSLLIAGSVLAALALAGPASAGYTAKIAGGTLTLTGNAKGDKLVLRLKKNAAGTLQVDVGGNGSVEFAFSRTRFAAIVVNAGGGHDTVTIDESRGVFTTTETTTLNGGPGNDRLNGGAGGETLDGGSGSDILNGKGGGDSARGGPGADTLSLGGGDDAARSVLGDGAETVSGGPGADVVTLTGTSGGDALRAARNGSAALLTRNVDGGSVRATLVERVVFEPGAGVDEVTVAELGGTGVTAVDVDLTVAGVADATEDRVTVEGSSTSDVFQAGPVAGGYQVTGLAAQVAVAGAEPAFDVLTLAGLGGDDSVGAGLLAGVTFVRLEGGDGSDVLNGGNGGDVLIGGAGQDVLDGNVGSDVVLAGDGNDVAVWDPGDGSDIVEGQAGTDTLSFNGSAGAEIFAASSNGSRLVFTRNVGNIVMDVDDVESVALNALGGMDTVTVNDLGPAGVASLAVDLGVLGADDGAADAVVLNGTAAAEAMVLSGFGGFSLRSGAFLLTGLFSDAADDSLTVNLGGGADLLGASGLSAGSIALTVNGGTGNDAIVGGAGNDVLNGEGNDDFLSGGAGNDTLDCGANVDVGDGGLGTDSAANCETLLNVP